jgi:hypothetical protein
LPRVVTEEGGERSEMVMEFAGHGFDLLAGNAEKRAVAKGAGTAHKGGSAFNRTSGNVGEQACSEGAHERADQEQSGETVESAGTMRGVERAVVRREAN